MVQYAYLTLSVLPCNADGTQGDDVSGSVLLKLILHILILKHPVGAEGVIQSDILVPILKFCNITISSQKSCVKVLSNILLTLTPRTSATPLIVKRQCMQPPRWIGKIEKDFSDVRLS